MSQTIATTAGKTYTLSFWLQNEASGTNDFKAIWNGQTLLSLTNAAQSGYTQHTYTVAATSSNSTLEFSAANGPSQWDLDNISLSLPALTSDPVSISGTAEEGQKLTAKATVNDPNATISYQWQYENGSIGASQTLKVINAPSQVSAGDSLDLAKILFGSNTTPGYLEEDHSTGTGGGFTVSDGGGHAATLGQLIQHAAAGFNLKTAVGRSDVLAVCDFFAFWLHQLGSARRTKMLHQS